MKKFESALNKKTLYKKFFMEDLPVDLIPRDASKSSHRIRIDITGRGDFKDVQGAFDGNLTIKGLFDQLKAKPALSKYLSKVVIDPKLGAQKLSAVSKDNVIELKIVGEGTIEVLNTPIKKEPGQEQTSNQPDQNQQQSTPGVNATGTSAVK